MNPLALGVDPGFASFGWALVRLSSSLVVEGMGVLRTAKSDAKRNVYATDDTLRRAREVSGSLLELLAPHMGDLRVVCAEAMSYPRVKGNVMAVAVSQMSMAWGIIALLAEQWDLPIVQGSPQSIKKALCGTQKATKEEVQATLDAQFGASLGEAHLKPHKVPKGQWEHPYDALAAVVALQHSDVVRAIRGVG